MTVTLRSVCSRTISGPVCLPDTREGVIVTKLPINLDHFLLANVLFKTLNCTLLSLEKALLTRQAKSADTQVTATFN